MRAREPDKAGHVVRDGVRVAYEIFGSGAPTLLLLPSWALLHARLWKGQVPYLSRYTRVVTIDPRALAERLAARFGAGAVVAEADFAAALDALLGSQAAPVECWSASQARTSAHESTLGCSRCYQHRAPPRQDLDPTASLKTPRGFPVGPRLATGSARP